MVISLQLKESEFKHTMDHGSLISLMGETSVETIHQCLKDQTNFMGCYSSTNLPQFPKHLPCSLIINVKTNAVKHWVGLLLTHAECFFFDSLASDDGLNEDILFFLAMQYKFIYYNRLAIQHFESETCGLFCCAFIMSVKDGFSFKDFLKRFDAFRLQRNDKIAIDIVRNYYDKCIYSYNK